MGVDTTHEAHLTVDRGHHDDVRGVIDHGRERGEAR